MKKLTDFIKREAVLSASAVLAAVSCFLVPPDREYLGYINYDTIIILFCLMVVVAGFSSLGVFSLLARSLLRRLRGQRALTLTLIALCFFGSMVITNDVALITFVPLALLVLELEGRRDAMCVNLTLMTVAANLGSMLTPIGNPQNLYIYSVSGLSFWDFTLTVLPYAAMSAILLVIAAWLMVRPAPVEVELEDSAPAPGRGALLYFGALFVLCLLTVAKVLPSYILLPLIVLGVAARDRRLLMKADYGLLATFICFFVFIGNMGRFGPFREAVLDVLEGHVLPVSALLSQVISNVPAALLLGGFTDRWRELLVGVNIGGLGTLIASMASLISYKQLAQHAPELKGGYFRMFTAVNFIFLALLLLPALVL